MSDLAKQNLASKQPETLEISESNDKGIFGFWVYLMTDCIMFASLFATYAVLRNNTFGGPSGAEIFELRNILAETLILLTSSFTCGLVMIAVRNNQVKSVIRWLGVTFLLGLAFLILELSEFQTLVADGHSWQISGFMSAFFTLVGTHGLHILAGLIWLVILVIKLWRRGLTYSSRRRLMMFSLFWHFLDVVWIFIFTVVYLMAFIKT